MIASCLEKSNKKIVIDRLMHSSNSVDTLVTDPDDIKHLTNEHFQKCAGGVNEEKRIPNRWRNQYAPCDHINENIYDNLMTPPSYDEWSEIIHDLLHDKAAGPSHITNEMLQHMDEKLG